MSRPSVIYIPPVVGEPKELESAFWDRHGLQTETQSIEWTGTDYEHELEIIGDRIGQLSGLGRVSLLGASGGGKAALSLFARHPDSIHRVVTVSSKVAPYAFNNPSTSKELPNLALSSDALPGDLEKMSDETRQRILCIRPRSDKVVLPEDAVLDGARSHTIPINGHADSIVYALTIGSKVAADFIRQD